MVRRKTKKPIHKTKLVYEDWFYHIFHVADNIEKAKDCRVCRWYSGLSEATKFHILRGYEKE